jgi:hypothetical protein
LPYSLTRAFACISGERCRVRPEVYTRSAGNHKCVQRERWGNLFSSFIHARQIAGSPIYPMERALYPCAFLGRIPFESEVSSPFLTAIMLISNFCITVTDTASVDDPNEISFSKGAILVILEKFGKWWKVKKEMALMVVRRPSVLLLTDSNVFAHSCAVKLSSNYLTLMTITRTGSIYPLTIFIHHAQS